MTVNFEEKFSERAKLFRASEIRELLKLIESPDIISLAGGMPDSRFFPTEQFKEVSEYVFKEMGKTALQYGATEGLKPLREILLSMMQKEGVDASLENLVVTTASQQGLSLVAQVFINPEDTVIVEEPTYLGAIQAFSTFQAKYEGIPLDDDGMRVDILEEKLKELKNKGVSPKFIYTCPNFHNPAGVTLTLERRKKLIELAASYGIPIIEDDPYGEVRFEGERIPPIIALAGTKNVIALRTFSKILAPGLRLGWVVGDKDVISKIVIGKQAADLCSPAVTQYLTLEFLKKGYLEPYLDLVRTEYKKKRDAMLQAMEEFFPKKTTWTHPNGGLFVWADCKTCNTSDLFMEAINHKVAYVVGIAFYPKRDNFSHMRLNFSAAEPEKIREGIKRLGNLLSEKVK